MDITKTLRELKEESQKTAREIAELSGVPLHTLNKLLNGQTTNPTYTTLKSVLAALGYKLEIASQNKLSEGAITESESLLIHRFRCLSEDGQNYTQNQLQSFLNYEENFGIVRENYDKTWIELPLYLLPASAGIGHYLDDSTYEMQPFKTDQVPQGTNFAIRVIGNSMEPQFTEGDIVFVKSEVFPEDGDVGVFTINGEAFLKEYRGEGLVSYNPEYPLIVPQEDDTVRMVGKVLGRYHPQ